MDKMQTRTRGLADPDCRLADPDWRTRGPGLADSDWRTQGLADPDWRTRGRGLAQNKLAVSSSIPRDGGVFLKGSS